jgi:protein ImuB
VPISVSPVEVVDRDGAPVVVTGRGVLTAPPARLSVAGERWVAVIGWSAPWPVEEGWWSRTARRSARLQVVTADGQAHLLLGEGGGWRLDASYD